MTCLGLVATSQKYVFDVYFWQNLIHVRWLHSLQAFFAVLHALEAFVDENATLRTVVRWPNKPWWQRHWQFCWFVFVWCLLYYVDFLLPIFSKNDVSFSRSHISSFQKVPSRNQSLNTCLLEGEALLWDFLGGRSFTWMDQFIKSIDWFEKTRSNRGFMHIN